MDEIGGFTGMDAAWKKKMDTSLEQKGFPRLTFWKRSRQFQHVFITPFRGPGIFIPLRIIFMPLGFVQSTQEEGYPVNLGFSRETK
jgi:hypothetical protein